MPEVVVITGGTAGVGRALARRFARHGAKVAILAPEKTDLRTAAVEAVSLGATAALAIPCDIDDEDELEAAAERIERELGPIDVWVDSVGELPLHRRWLLALGAGAAAAAVGLGAYVTWRHFRSC